MGLATAKTINANAVAMITDVTLCSLGGVESLGLSPVERRMDEIVETYDREVRDRIEEVLREHPLTLEELVRACWGAYPGVVLNQLKSIKHAVRVGEKSYHLAEQESRSKRSSLYLVESNPVLSSWYFTNQSCEKINALRDWSGYKLAFLGTPKLFEWFVQAGIEGEHVLFELDSLVVKTLSESCCSASRSLYLYDVRDDPPADLIGTFDCVFFDPPWYPADYALWLHRASQLAPGGTFIFPLFQELTRPTAKAERHQLLRDLAKCESGSLLLASFVQYETPSFEQAQLRALGFSDLVQAAWRVADLMVVSSNGPLGSNGSKREGTLASWSEVQLGSLRLFINSAVSWDGGPLLESASPSGALVLESPSRRDPGLALANVLTSRGHGLRTPRPAELLGHLRELQSSLDQANAAGEAISRLQIDAGAKRILSAILEV